MVNGKMCVGVYSHGDMMVQRDPDMTDELVTKKGARQAKMRGKLLDISFIRDSRIDSRADSLRYIPLNSFGQKYRSTSLWSGSRTLRKARKKGLAEIWKLAKTGFWNLAQ